MNEDILKNLNSAFSEMSIDLSNELTVGWGDNIKDKDAVTIKKKIDSIHGILHLIEKNL